MEFLTRVRAALGRVRTRMATAFADRDTEGLRAANAAKEALLERITGEVEQFANEVDATYGEPEEAETEPADEAGDDDGGEDAASEAEQPEGGEEG